MENDLVNKIQAIADSDTFEEKEVVNVEEFYRYVLNSEWLPIKNK